jgi:hypothetical protein
MQVSQLSRKAKSISDLAIEVKLGHSDLPILPNEFLTDEEEPEIYTPVDPEGDMPEADAFNPEMYNQYISAEVMVPRDDILIPAKVIGRQHDQDGK